MYHSAHSNKVKAKIGVIVFFFIFFFLFTNKAWGRTIEVEKLIDNTFYDSYCQEEALSWLCQINSSRLGALKEVDGWEIVPGDFFTNSGENYLEFIFVPQEPLENSSHLFLKLALRSLNNQVGLGKLWVDCEDGQHLVLGGAGNNWFILGGSDSLEENIDLAPFCSSLLSSWQDQELKIKLSALPFLTSSSPLLVAIDEMKIEAQENSLPLPSPISALTSPTPTLAPTPTLSPTLTPTATPAFSEEHFSWASPQDGETVSGQVELKMALGSEDFKAEKWRFYYRRLGDRSWRRIWGNVWLTASLPLDRYQLKAELKDTQQSQEINVVLGAKIFNVFFTGKSISWQTDRPVLARVVYDRSSHSLANPLFPNFGYRWSSPLLGEKKNLSHQFVWPNLPPGRYFYRLLALGETVSFSREYSFASQDILFPSSGTPTEETEEVLGATAAAHIPSPSLSPSPPSSDRKRLLFYAFLGFFVGGIVFYLTKEGKKILMKNNEK